MNGDLLPYVFAAKNNVKALRDKNLKTSKVYTSSARVLQLCIFERNEVRNLGGIDTPQFIGAWGRRGGFIRPKPFQQKVCKEPHFQ